MHRVLHVALSWLFGRESRKFGQPRMDWVVWPVVGRGGGEEFVGGWSCHACLVVPCFLRVWGEVLVGAR